VHAGDCVNLVVHDCLTARQRVLLIFSFLDCKYKLLKLPLSSLSSSGCLVRLFLLPTQPAFLHNLQHQQMGIFAGGLLLKIVGNLNVE